MPKYSANKYKEHVPIFPASIINPMRFPVTLPMTVQMEYSTNHFTFVYRVAFLNLDDTPYTNTHNHIHALHIYKTACSIVAEFTMTINNKGNNKYTKK